MSRCPTRARSEVRQESAARLKRYRGWREHTTAALERPQNRRFEFPHLFSRACAGGKFLHHHGAEKRRWKRNLQKTGQRFSECFIAERIHEHVRIERELHARFSNTSSTVSYTHLR